jgi:uncharacterized protein YciI
MSRRNQVQPGPAKGYLTEIHRLILGIMVKGARWTPGSTPEDEADQAAHLKLLDRLRGEGKLLLSGPIPEVNPERGVLIFDFATEAEVQRLLAEDAHLKSGPLDMRLWPWLVPADLVEKLLPSPAEEQTPKS